MSHKQSPNSPAKSECPCFSCASKVERVWWMVVCDNCGNKRCPHGSDHRYLCTGSNDTGQRAVLAPNDAIPATHSPEPAQEAPVVIRELQAARETKWAEAMHASYCGSKCTPDEDDLEDARPFMALAAEETFEATSALRQELAQAQAEVAHWEHHAWEAGEGFKRAIDGTNRAHAYRRAAEAREVSLRKAIEALANEWECRDDIREADHWRGFDFVNGKAFGYEEAADDLRAALAAEPTPAAQLQGSAKFRQDLAQEPTPAAEEECRGEGETCLTHGGCWVLNDDGLYVVCDQADLYPPTPAAEPHAEDGA